MSFSRQGEEEVTSVQTRKKRRPPPPDDVHYWMTKLEWPRRFLDAEKPAKFGPVDLDGTIGSVEDIREDLREHAAWDSSFLDSIGQELAELESVLQAYRRLYLGEGPKPEGLKDRDGLTHLPKTFLTELEEKEEDMIQRLVDNQRRMRSVAHEQDHSPGQCEKTAEKQALPAECQSEGLVPALPHYVDAFFIVDKVSQVESGAGQKVWKRVCYCKEALKMLQGTFWWFWMEKFKPNRSLQDNLFDVIAKMFVSIILPMPLEASDKFIEHYPRCLAEAVFCVFLNAYPQSVRKFNSNFRRDLANLVTLWITGLKAAPGSWDRWPVLASLPLLRAAEADQESERAQRQVASARQALASMQRELDEGHVRFRDSGPHREVLTRAAGDQQYFVKESHPIGTGMEFERIRFTIFSRSPLVHHYLLLHQLTVEDYNRGQGLTWTELTTLPDTRALTYNNYLLQQAQDQHQKYTDYQTEMAQKGKEVTKMLKEHAATLREMQRKNKELLGRKHEVKVMSEKLVEQLKNTHPSFSKDKYLGTRTKGTENDGKGEQTGEAKTTA